MISEFPLGLYVMRHCITGYNLTYKISGQSNLSIVDFSINTSALDLISIKHNRITIISSPLARCLQTTSLLLKQYNEFHPYIHVDSRIIERSMGNWEGELKADILREYPQYNYCGHINPLLTPPCGETIDDFLKRIDEFIQYLQIISQYTPILICAHNQSLKLLIYRLTERTDLLDFWISCCFENGKIESIY